MESVRTSSLAGQIDPNILPFIYFGPVSEGEQRSWHQSGGNHLYWDLFEKILECQKTSSNKLPPHLLQSFQKLSFHEQLTNFKLSQQLTEDQRRVRWQIAVDVFSAIRASPLHRIRDATVFGSLVTGINNPVSDINISVNVDGDNGQALERKSNEEIRKIYSHFKRSLKAVLKNAPSPHDAAQKLISAVHLKERHLKYIRLQESKTGVMIDLEFNGKLGIRDAKLLQFYNNFEPKTKELIIFLNYWAKFHHVSGSHKFTKTSMRILILVFLMDKNMIPSMLLLQAIAAFQRSERGETNDPDTQESYFCDDHEVISKYFTPAIRTGQINTPEEDAKVFIDLLTDFFRMVVTTRFPVCLVSPQLGQIVQKEQMGETVSNCVNALPSDLGYCWRKLSPNYFFSSILFSDNVAAVIQNPFEINDNTARLCSEESLDEFVSAAKYTLSILRNNPSSLLELFVRCPTPVKRKFSDNTQPSENDEYTSTLRNKMLKTESEGESKFKENAAIEILQAVRDIAEVPDWLFKDPEEFDAICLHRSEEFLNKYMVKLYKWDMLGSSKNMSRWQIMLQVTALWGRFAKQYLEEFFTKALILPEEGVTMKMVDVIRPISSTDMWTYDDTYTQEKIAFFERTMVKKVNPRFVWEARKKIRELHIPENSIRYGVIEVKVTYPFWKRKHHKGNTNMRHEAEISKTSYKEHLSRTIAIAEGAAGQTNRFTPFIIYVLYKLDTRADEANQLCADPTITLSVQEFNEGNISPEVRRERVLARKCVIEIFKRTFYTFLQQKFSGWAKD